jgi:hypothetical protein
VNWLHYFHSNREHPQVIWDHRALLRQARVSAAGFWWDCGLIFDEAAAGIFYPVGTSLQSAWRREAGLE